MTEGPTKAVVYIRVSTDKQATSGVGAEAQEDACRKYCELRGLAVLEVVSDVAVSGMEEAWKRPGMLRALAAIGSHPKGDVMMVVYKLDRLARSQRIIWELLDPRGKYALPLASATQEFNTATPIGRAMIGMLGVFAELDWENIRERNLAMQRAARARGAKFGAPRMADRLHEKTLRQIHKLYDTGLYSQKELAGWLNAAGVKSAGGRKWHASSVHAALKIKL